MILADSSVWIAFFNDVASPQADILEQYLLRHEVLTADLILMEVLQGCRAIPNNDQRLACFDAASAKLSAAVEAKQIVVIEDKEVKRAKRTLFGFRLPDLSIFGGEGNDTEEDKTLTTTVASVRRAEAGRWNIGIPEGAIWQTTEPLQINPAVGDALEIKVGIMGGYFLKVRNKRSVRAKRID